MQLMFEAAMVFGGFLLVINFVYLMLRSVDNSHQRTVLEQRRHGSNPTGWPFDARTTNLMRSALSREFELRRHEKMKKEIKVRHVGLRIVDDS